MWGLVSSLVSSWNRRKSFRISVAAARRPLQGRGRRQGRQICSWREGLCPTVMDASLFDLFRLVRFHGGKQHYLSWRAEDELPIMIMSPVHKLAEGPGCAFSASWAFMEASDDQVKLRFRQWMDVKPGRRCVGKEST